MITTDMEQAGEFSSYIMFYGLWIIPGLLKLARTSVKGPCTRQQPQISTFSSSESSSYESRLLWIAVMLVWGTFSILFVVDLWNIWNIWIKMPCRWQIKLWRKDTIYSNLLRTQSSSSKRCSGKTIMNHLSSTTCTQFYFIPSLFPYYGMPHQHKFVNFLFSQQRRSNETIIHINRFVFHVLTQRTLAYIDFIRQGMCIKWIRNKIYII